MSDLEKGRRLARRRMAWISFVFMIVSGVSILASLLLLEERLLIAKALDDASGPIISIFTVNSAIVLGYLGVSMVERAFGKER